nr:hypothetical protein [Rhizoctonia sp.]
MTFLNVRTLILVPVIIINVNILVSSIYTLVAGDMHSMMEESLPLSPLPDINGSYENLYREYTIRPVIDILSQVGDGMDEAFTRTVVKLGSSPITPSEFIGNLSEYIAVEDFPDSLRILAIDVRNTVAKFSIEQGISTSAIMESSDSVLIKFPIDGPTMKYLVKTTSNKYLFISLEPR